MATLYWIGNNSTDVNTAANWSLYPLVGLTLPPAAIAGPTHGDALQFDWPGESGSAKPLYTPLGTINANLTYVHIDENFQLNIGSSVSRLGVSAGYLNVHKLWSSTYAQYTTNTPSVYITSNGNATKLRTSITKFVERPASWTGSFVNVEGQCIMDLEGTFTQVLCGGAENITYTNSNNQNVQMYRQEELKFGLTNATTIGGFSETDRLFIESPTAKTKFDIGDECIFFTPYLNIAESILNPVVFEGAGINLTIRRGADFLSNCGGITIKSSDTTYPFAQANICNFLYSGFTGATGFDSNTRTGVSNFTMTPFAEASSLDPYVLIQHGVDFTGKVTVETGTFEVTENIEVTRTTGSGSSMQIFVDGDETKNPVIRLADNSSFRNIKVTHNSGVAGRLNFNMPEAPLKTLFINQPIIEGYTGV
jgi:hypothetical protein